MWWMPPAWIFYCVVWRQTAATACSTSYWALPWYVQTYSLPAPSDGGYSLIPALFTEHTTLIGTASSVCSACVEENIIYRWFPWLLSCIPIQPQLLMKTCLIRLIGLLLYFPCDLENKYIMGLNKCVFSTSDQNIVIRWFEGRYMG